MRIRKHRKQEQANSQIIQSQLQQRPFDTPGQTEPVGNLPSTQQQSHQPELSFGEISICASGNNTPTGDYFSGIQLPANQTPSLFSSIPKVDTVTDDNGDRKQQNQPVVVKGLSDAASPPPVQRQNNSVGIERFFFLQRSPQSFFNSSIVIQRDGVDTPQAAGEAYEEKVQHYIDQVPELIETKFKPSIMEYLTGKANTRFTSKKLGTSQNQKEFMPQDFDRTLTAASLKGFKEAVSVEQGEANQDATDIADQIVKPKAQDFIRNAYQKMAQHYAETIYTTKVQPRIKTKIEQKLQNAKVKFKNNQDDAKIWQSLKEFNLVLQNIFNTVAISNCWQKSDKETAKKELDDKLLSDFDNTVKDQLTADVNQQGKTLGAKELEDRPNLDNDIKEILADLPHTKFVKIQAELTNYIEEEIGANGSKFWRSSANQKRKTIKQLARKATVNKTLTHLDQSYSDDFAGKPATKEYFAMKAKQQSLHDGKVVANQVLKNIARQGAVNTLEKCQVKSSLEAIARQTAWLQLRQNKNKTKVAEAVKKTLNDKYDGLLQEVKTAANTWQGDLFRAIPKEDADASEDDVITKEITQQTANFDTNSSIQKVKKTIEANSPSAAINTLATLIDLVVPEAGQEAKLDITFKIPAGTGFVLLGISAVAARGLSGVVNAAPTLDAYQKNERNSDRVECRGDFKLGGGIKFPGIEAKVTANMFLRAAAANSTKAAQTMSYGIYRTLVKENNSTAAFWWADTDKKLKEQTDIGQNQQAETWAAYMEEKLFAGDENEGATVDIGMGGALSADASLSPDLGVSAALGYAHFSRYKKDQIGKYLGQSPTSKEDAKKRIKGIKGKHMNAASFSLTGKLGKVANVGVKGSVAWADSEIKTWEIQLLTNISLGQPGDPKRKVADLISAIQEFVKMHQTVINHDDEKNSKRRFVAAQLSGILQYSSGTLNGKMEEQLQKIAKFDQKDRGNLVSDEALTDIEYSSANTTPLIGSKRNLKVSLAFGLNQGRHTFRFSASDVSKTSINIGVFSGSLERSKLVGSFFLDLGKSAAQKDKEKNEIEKLKTEEEKTQRRQKLDEQEKQIQKFKAVVFN